MKSVILYSGGKDSTMAVYESQKNGDEIYALLAMVSRNKESYMFHVPDIHMVDYCSAAMEIPSIDVLTDGVKEEELNDLEQTLTKLKDKGVEAVYSGALESVYQKSRIDKICKKLGLKSISPLWHRNPIEYMQEIVDLGFEVIITSVSAYGLTKEWLGKTITQETIEEIKELNTKYGIHPAFEGGEAETLVLDGPMFDRKIVIDEAEITWNFDNGIYDIKKAHLEEKYDYSL
ncbi:TIGR00289 family protein [Methanosphaera sp. ISO3-F5]|uniref:diphthine--ammonia ligase n=1 Tax=Methanosphaera sp. ISO3-F5 TaxID=1452353 RepID=UPI002B25FB1E|nr:TIGR00289 family protein [Methanosphaera sp. ISO3-F5]WQH63378.1 TIGR00289 family protein [Methanosphaera sp. ISO3-F5]